MNAATFKTEANALCADPPVDMLDFVKALVELVLAHNGVETGNDRVEFLDGSVAVWNDDTCRFE